MLHGEIKINGTELAEWTAVNTKSAADPMFPEYRCTLTYRDKQGYLWETGEYFIYGYARVNGPVSLAARILAGGHHRLVKKRPVAIQEYLDDKDNRRRNA